MCSMKDSAVDVDIPKNVYGCVKDAYAGVAAVRCKMLCNYRSTVNALCIVRGLVVS